MQAGDVKAKAKKQQCCAAWMWSWLVVFFAIIGASDYARVSDVTTAVPAALQSSCACISLVSCLTADCAGSTFLQELWH
jgi:hypothetical protein